MTLFDSYCDCGVSAAIGVQHRGPKSGRKLVTLFDSYCDGGGTLAIHCYNRGNYYNRFVVLLVAIWKSSVRYRKSAFIADHGLV